jgi:hypothetical protein
LKCVSAWHSQPGFQFPVLPWVSAGKIITGFQAAGVKEKTMNSIRRIFCIATFGAACAMPCLGQVAVIVHPDNHENLTPDMVRSIFLGKIKVFNNGLPIFAIGLEPGDPVRHEFQAKVLRKSDAAEIAYWDNLLSRSSPPEEVENSSSVVKFVAENRFAIGYVDVHDIDDTVKVLEVWR